MDSQKLIGVHKYAAMGQDSNLLQICSALESLVADSGSRGFSSERHIQHLYEAVVSALTIVGRDCKHAAAECRRVLVPTRSLCALLWSSCGETEKVLSLRYTLVRRLLAVRENRSCLEESWSLLEDLLCQPLNETFNIARCHEVCLHNKDNKVFVTILVGTVLNLIRLLAEKSDVSPVRAARVAIDAIVRISNVIPSTVEVVLTLPGDSVQRHARSFVNGVMVLPIYSTEKTSGSIATARQRFGFALISCLNHVSFEKAYLVHICNKIISLLTLSEFHEPLSQIICQKLSEQHDYERVSIYHQVVLRAVQTREHSEVLTFLERVSRIGEADSLLLLMLRTTIIFAMQAEQHILIKSLAQTNIEVYEKLLNSKISRHPSCFHVYGLLAREIQIFSQKQQHGQAWSADVVHEIQNFSYSSLDIIERSANEGLVVHKACMVLVEACLPTALSMLLMELTAKDRHKVSKYAITLNMIKRLMSNATINTISTRRIIHSFAKKYAESGLLDAAEKLYTINVECLNSEVVEVFEDGERHARIKSLVRHLCHSGKHSTAVDILLNKSEHHGTGEVPLQLALQLNAEMSREYGAHGPTTCSFVAHLIRKYGCKNDYCRLLQDENEHWNSVNASVELRHRVQSSILDAAVTLLKSNGEVVHLHNYVRVICNMLRLVRTFPKHSISCTADSCKICSHMAILHLYQEVEGHVKRNNVPNGQILLLELTCWITLALIDTGEDSAYERAHSLMENAIEAHGLSSFTAEVTVVNSFENDFEHMCEAVQCVCEFFNLHGSTYFSSQFRAYLCGDTKSYVASILLAPVLSPCLFLGVRRGRPHRKCVQMCADYHQGQSMLTLGGILAERGDFNEAFSYIEIAVNDLRSSFYNAKIGNCFKAHSGGLHHRTSIFKIFGMYVTALCSKAVICAELGMFSYSLSTIDEALKWCAVVGVTRMQKAVRLRRAYILTRSGELEKASNELLRCDADATNVLLGSRTQFDEYAERYSRALLFMTESFCYQGAKQTEAHRRTLSFVGETIDTTLKYSGLNRFCHSLVTRTCPKDSIQIVTYWSSPWCSMRANLLYRHVANSSVESGQSHSALCTLVSGTRNYQPFLLILLLLCELKMKHSIDLRLDECLPYISGSISINRMSRDVESIISRILWLVRDWPSLFCHLQTKLLSMAFAGDLLNSAALVSGLQTHCGASIRSQCLAAMTSKLLQRFENDDAFVHERNKLHCSQYVPFSSVRKHLRVSEREINQLVGIKQRSSDCLEHAHLIFPVVTIGLLQKSHVDGGIPEFIISRVHSASDSSVCVRFTDPSICEIFDRFSKLLQVQHDVPEPSSSRESKINWWDKRLQIDTGLHQILDEFSSSLGAWRVLLLGDTAMEPVKQELCELTTQATARMEDVALELNLYVSASASELIYVLLAGAEFITDDEFCCALFSVLLPRDANVVQNECHVISTHYSYSQEPQQSKSKISKVVQFLRQALTTALHCHKSYTEKESERDPVILVLGDGVNNFAWESLDVLKSQRVYRNPSMAIALTMASHWSSAFKAKDIERSFFVLNPRGDLAKTQKVLEPLLLQTGWDGVTGLLPAPSKVLSALQESDFYLYFGHGGGQDVLSTDVIQNADVESVTLLMGCSSGAYNTSDTTSSVSICLSYLLAGAPAVIANLWDVTDGDIDRFSTGLIQNWRSSSHSGAAVCLSTSLQNARNVCQLKYLVGAAPVLFGIPTEIGISQRKR